MSTAVRKEKCGKTSVLEADVVVISINVKTRLLDQYAVVCKACVCVPSRSPSVVKQGEK